MCNACCLSDAAASVCRLHPVIVTVLYTATKHAMRADVTVKLTKASDSLELRVQDRGRGFADVVLDRFRLSSAQMDTLHPESALSVGLTACKRTCESLGCKLELSNADPSNKQRKGGLIRVRIPCRQSF